LDASGRLGVGTTSPSAKFAVNDGTNRTVLITTDATQLGTSGMCIGGFNDNATGYVPLSLLGSTLHFGTGGSERARIDSSGNLLVGFTAGGLHNSGSFQFSPGTSSYGGVFTVNHSTSNVTGSGYMNFGYNGSAIGSISQNGTTAVAYNTSSDYRLKNTIAPMTGALAKVALLKPVTYKWNVDGSDGEGFIAHELAEVCPDAVSGAKDAVDVDGNPKYQGIDTSFLVATLTAAIQELNAKFEAYKASHP
jgi:hypothetical protein